MTLFEEFITPTTSLNGKMLRHMPSLTRHWQHCVMQRKSLQWDLNGKQERWKCNLVEIGRREMGLLWVGFGWIGSFCGNLVVDSASSPQELFCSWWYRDAIYYTHKAWCLFGTEGFYKTFTLPKFNSSGGYPFCRLEFFQIGTVQTIPFFSSPNDSC